MVATINVIMTEKITQACRSRPSILPYIRTRANGKIIIAMHVQKFVTALGFSNGAPPYGGFGAYVIATLSDLPPVHVPGPIVGAGLPGLFTAFGIWWLNRRRQKAA